MGFPLITAGELTGSSTLLPRLPLRSRVLPSLVSSSACTSWLGLPGEWSLLSQPQSPHLQNGHDPSLTKGLMLRGNYVTTVYTLVNHRELRGCSSQVAGNHGAFWVCFFCPQGHPRRSTQPCRCSSAWFVYSKYGPSLSGNRGPFQPLALAEEGGSLGMLGCRGRRAWIRNPSQK